MLVLSLLVAAGCDDAQTPTEPLFEELFTASEEVELAILADNQALDMAIELVSTSANVATQRGHRGASDGQTFTAQARVRFQNAQNALNRGEHRVALSEALKARRLVAAGIEATGGERAVSAMVERLEDIAITASDNPGVFDDAVAVASELSILAAEARSALSRGDVASAGERGVLGEQRARNRRAGHNGRPGNVTADRAELAIALGGTAIDLAERLLEGGADEEQMRFLATAHEFLEGARAALAAGDYQRAVHLAELANWNALKAVVLPGGVTVDEQRAMVDLAKSLYADPVAALGDTPSSLQVQMLERAGRLIQLGETMIDSGQGRGVGALWQGAVISSWLIG